MVKIKKKDLAFLFLSVAVLVVMGGSHNPLMFGNAAEAAFYRLAQGKDIRMLFFYCKNISLPTCLAKQSLFCKQSNWFYLLKKKKENITTKAAYAHRGVLFSFIHLSYSVL